MSWPIRGRVAEIYVNATDGPKYYYAHYLSKKNYYFAGGPNYRYIQMAKTPVRNTLLSDRWLVSPYDSKHRSLDIALYYITIFLTLFFVVLSTGIFFTGVFASVLRRKVITRREDIRREREYRHQQKEKN